MMWRMEKMTRTSVFVCQPLKKTSFQSFEEKIISADRPKQFGMYIGFTFGKALFSHLHRCIDLKVDYAFT
jgi:hypothetical protein